MKIIEKLIENVRNYPCLYDREHPLYRNKLERKNSWNLISKVVGADVAFCQLRWKSLRDRYAKETLRPKPGRRTPDVKLWEFLESLAFLQNHIRPRGSEHGSCPEPFFAKKEESLIENDYDFTEPPFPFISTTQFTEDSGNSFNDTISTRTASSMITAKRKNMPETTCERIDTLCDVVTELISKKGTEPIKRSRNEDYLKVLDSYLLKLPEGKQDELKIKILNIVYDESKEF